MAPCLWCLSRSRSTRDQNTGKHCWTLIIISHRFSLAFYLRCMPGYANLVQLGRLNGAVCVKYLLQFQAPPSTQEILAADLISVSNSPTLNFFTMLPGLQILCVHFLLSLPSITPFNLFSPQSSMASKYKISWTFIYSCLTRCNYLILLTMLTQPSVPLLLEFAGRLAPNTRLFLLVVSSPSFL